MVWTRSTNYLWHYTDFYMRHYQRNIKTSLFMNILGKVRLEFPNMKNNRFLLVNSSYLIFSQDYVHLIVRNLRTSVLLPFTFHPFPLTSGPLPTITPSPYQPTQSLRIHIIPTHPSLSWRIQSLLILKNPISPNP